MRSKGITTGDTAPKEDSSLPNERSRSTVTNNGLDRWLGELRQISEEKETSSATRAGATALAAKCVQRLAVLLPSAITDMLSCERYELGNAGSYELHQF